jgi:hypothetical protein
MGIGSVVQQKKKCGLVDAHHILTNFISLHFCKIK